MKIRHVEELVDALDTDFSGRKRELTTLRFEILNAKEHRRAALCRACICILYAHFEGFVKFAAECYLALIDRQGLPIGRLTPNLVAACLRNEIMRVSQTKSPQAHTQLVNMVLSAASRVSLSSDFVVDTASNLNSRVLRDILALVGVDPRPYATHDLMIDGKLLYYRNAVAHGQQIRVELADYELLHTAIIGLMGRFNDDVQNAATCKAYVRQA